MTTLSDSKKKQIADAFKTALVDLSNLEAALHENDVMIMAQDVDGLWEQLNDLKEQFLA